MRNPKITTILPVHNGQDTLAAAMHSVLQQQGPEHALLVIDDGSSDASAQIALNIARQDHRVRVMSPGRIGLVAALNLGLQHAQSPIIARMDADDICLPHRFARQYQYLENHPNCVLVSGQVDITSDVPLKAGYRAYQEWLNACLTPQQIAEQIYVESPHAHPTVMFRKSIVTSLGGYRDGAFPEDYELWLRLHASGYAMAKLPEVVLQWRDAPDRTSRTDQRYNRAAFDALRAQYLVERRAHRLWPQYCCLGCGPADPQTRGLCAKSGIGGQHLYRH